MKAQVEKVTPEMAASWIAVGTENRPLNKRKIAKFVSDILEGRWVLNGQPFIINKQGGLSDGNHMAHAVVQSGRSIYRLVVRGVEHEVVFPSIDCGASRDGEDLAKLLGFENYTVTSAIATRLAAWLHRVSDTPSFLKQYTASKPELLEIMDANRARLQDLSRKCKKFKHQRGALGFAWFVFGEKYPRKTEEFMKQVLEQENINRSHASWHLCRVLHEKGAARRIHQEVVIAYIFRALQAHVAGVEVKKLRPATELTV